jgi:hypothetical protein
VVAQRDRMRAKAATLEEAAAAAAVREAAAVAQVAKLQADNDALYERVRFVEGYAASQVGARVVGAMMGSHTSTKCVLVCTAGSARINIRSCLDGVMISKESGYTRLDD